MSENTTNFEGLNANSTTDATSAKNGYLTFDFLFLEVRLVLSAMGIIYLGAHAALRRPPSAAKRLPKDGKKQHKDEEDDAAIQGLLPSDAILFPVMAAVMLVGLYYLIKWLKDPELLNKILRYYMTTVSLVSVVTFYAHGIDLASSFVFPMYWRGRDGEVRKAMQNLNKVVTCDAVGNQIEDANTGRNPLPGLFSVFGHSPSIWKIRSLFTQYAHLRVFAIRMGEDYIRVRFSHLCGFVLSVVTAGLYFATKSPQLSNMLGYGMCYGSFLLLSPTDLLTSSLVMAGLFVYDIVMVFYT